MTRVKTIHTLLVGSHVLVIM